MSNEVTKDTICKISEARLGSYDGRFGLHFTLSGHAWGVGHSRIWSWHGKPGEANIEEMAKALAWLDGLLRDAKVESLHQLVGKPAVSEWRGGSQLGGVCIGFRILTEVI